MLDNFEIVPYRNEFKEDFKSLNVEWISKFFKMETSDFKALDHPDDYILDGGGFIFVALVNNKAVGVCALIKMHNSSFDFELAKMAVSPNFQGNKIGYFLAKEAIEKAKSLEAKSIYLESNSLLASAINLYKKLGFIEVKGYPSPYDRVDIQMSLSLI